jgi:hypothetical protein
MYNFPPSIQHHRCQSGSNETGPAGDQRFFWHLVSFDIVKITITPMNRLTLAILTVLLSAHIVSAQKVTAKKETQKIKNKTAQGFSTELDGKVDDVTAAWNKFLKDTGKGKSSGDMLAIAEPALGGTVYEEAILYATWQGIDGKAHVWLGLIEEEWKVNDIEIVYKEVEQLVYRFGVKFYKDKIQLQIDESLSAQQAVERQAQRSMNEGKTLANRLTNNEQQKIQLEKSLEENKLENLVLKQKIVNNKKAQDSLANAAVQIQKVVEMHKERQLKVN